MRCYWLNGYPDSVHEGSLYVGTFAEVREFTKKLPRGWRSDFIATEVDILTDKTALLRILNDEGQMQTPTGRYWSLSPRGGLRPCDSEGRKL